MLPVKIAGLGWYLPERRVTNADLEEQLGIPADWIAVRFGESQQVGCTPSFMASSCIWSYEIMVRAHPGFCPV